MAKNYVQDGSAIALIAPAGGITSGQILAIDQLVVVALVTAAAGEEFSARTDGVWSVPCAAGLETGAVVGLLDGELVAGATELAVAAGKLVSDETGGYANLLLSN